jgi:hypothetical protein
MIEGLNCCQFDANLTFQGLKYITLNKQNFETVKTWLLANQSQ